MTATPSTGLEPVSRHDDTRSRQHERFNWFVDRLDRWVGYYDLGELRDFLHGETQWPGQREKALVLLALDETDEALEVLLEFDVEDEDPEFRQLYQIALRQAVIARRPGS
ncbi:MAG: hypothetical protein ABEN55_06950 [Bradymonadaceae bacterium]